MTVTACAMGIARLEMLWLFPFPMHDHHHQCSIVPPWVSHVRTKNSVPSAELQEIMLQVPRIIGFGQDSDQTSGVVKKGGSLKEACYRAFDKR